MTDTPPPGWTPLDEPGAVRRSAVPPVPYQPGWHPYPVMPQQPGVPLAEIWQRLLAYVIDQAVFSAVGGVLLAPVFFLAFYRMSDSFPDPGETTRPAEMPVFPAEFLALYGLALGATLLLLFAYQSVSVAVWGGTAGKKAMKLRVVRASDGGEVGWGRAMARAGATTVLSLIPCVGWLNPAWVLWDKPNRQALHDKIAGTLVVRTDPAPIGPRAEFTG